ncbi:MAG: hypothetical protein IJI45_02365 [Anaerolineaceae bacterium]|nr:hypothetical protein [Anaerolineaceae bacterium]
MSVEKQAQNLGFRIVGKLSRCGEMELSKRYLCFLDEAGNRYVLYRGILTIIASDGRVF